MPGRRPARPAPLDVDTLRANLAQGKIVRVGLVASGQFPDGATGRVRRIGDPAVDGDEFIFVEVPVGGAKDVLPFAASDLTAPAARSKTGSPIPKATATVAARRPAANSVKASLVEPPVAPASSEQSPAPSPITTAPRRAEPQPDSRPTPEKPKAVSRNQSAASRGKRAPVTITISTAGDESAAWRIEARIGAKIAVRPTTIPPARVWEIVESLGEPKLSAVVHALLDEHRRSTQARADALATELSALQAELQSFPIDGG